MELEQLPIAQLQALTAQEELQQNLGHQAELTQQHQSIRNRQLGAHGQANYQAQQEMGQMRGRNRQRGKTPSQASTDPMPVIQEHPNPTIGRDIRAPSAGQLRWNWGGFAEFPVLRATQFAVRIRPDALRWVPEYGLRFAPCFYHCVVSELGNGETDYGSLGILAQPPRNCRRN